jgi:hypothetical protein
LSKIEERRGGEGEEEKKKQSPGSHGYGTDDGLIPGHSENYDISTW